MAWLHLNMSLSKLSKNTAKNVSKESINFVKELNDRLLYCVCYRSNYLAMTMMANPLTKKE